MNARELKILLDSVPADTEIKMRNHHLEDKPIIKAMMKLEDKNTKHTRMVLTLAEETL